MSYKPVQFQDPMEMYGRRQQIQANALAMQAQQKAQETKNALAQVFAQGGDMSSPDTIKKVMALDPTTGMALQQHFATMNQSKAATAASEATTAGELSKQTQHRQVKTGLALFNAVSGDASDANLNQVATQLKDAGHSDDDITATLSPILALPVEQRSQAIKTQLSQSQEGRDALNFVAPKIDHFDAGGKIIFRDTNPNSPTFKQEFGTITKTATPDAIMAAGTAANRLAYEKAHNVITDAFREREVTAKENGGEGKPLTEGQAKATGYAMRAKQAENDLGSIANFNPSAIASKQYAEGMPVVGALMGPLVNKALSENDQLAEQAQRNFINAVMRRDSGAAVNEKEWLNARQQYFDQPNDKPATIAQKARNREVAIAALKIGAGPGMKRANAASAAPATLPRLTPDQAKKLPPGTTFIGTDGVQRTTH